MLAVLPKIGRQALPAGLVKVPIQINEVDPKAFPECGRDARIESYTRNWVPNRWYMVFSKTHSVCPSFASKARQRRYYQCLVKGLNGSKAPLTRSCGLMSKDCRGYLQGN